MVPPVQMYLLPYLLGHRVPCINYGYRNLWKREKSGDSEFVSALKNKNKHRMTSGTSMERQSTGEPEPFPEPFQRRCSPHSTLILTSTGNLSLSGIQATQDSL